MKVSVFEIRMSDGSGGRVMVPCVAMADRPVVERLFKESKDGVSIRYCSWENNMWVTESITGPIVIRTENEGKGGQTNGRLL